METLFCPLAVGRSQGPLCFQNWMEKIIWNSRWLEFYQNHDTEMLFSCVLKENKSRLSGSSALDRLCCDVVHVTLREFCSL